MAGLMLAAACGNDDDSASGDTSGDATETTAVSVGTETTAESPANAPGYAGELKVAGTEPKTMDPAKLTSESGGDWDRPAAIFDTLLRWKKDGTYVGQLAESMDSSDAVTWTLKLRPDINFTDGTPLNAEAVLFNIERQRDPANAFGGAGALTDLKSVTAIDDLTVEFVLNAPNGTFWEGFAGFNGFIGSPTAIKADPEGFGSKPIGAGPYVLKEFVRDSFTVLERNPDYWDTTKPAYETVRVQMYPDPIARAEALSAGEVDLGYAAGVASLNQLGDPDPKGLKVYPADGATFILFNHSRGITQDVRVREAISLAFEPEAVRDAVLGGKWDELEMVCPPFTPDDPRCVPGLWPKPDPDKARQIIADYAAEGNSVDVTLLATSNVQGEAEFIQQTLNAIGLKVALDVKPGAEWLPMVNAGDFDMSWYATGQPVAPRLFYHFRSDQRNLIKANIPEYDEAVLKARTALSPDEQMAGWKTVQEILATKFLVGYYAPFRDGYVVKKSLDLGDQTQTIRLHYSEVSPA